MKKVNYLLQILKGLAAAVIVTVIGVAVLALFVKDLDADSNLVSGLSVAVKVVSIALGTILAAIKIRKKGALIGAFVAIPYWAVCFLLSIIGSTPVFSFGLLIDLALTVLTGVFSGILTVNTLK